MKSVSANVVQVNRPTPGLWALAGMVSLASSLLLFWANEQQSAIRIAKATLARATASQSVEQTPSFRVPSAPSYERSARELLKERLLPWSEALTALEATKLDGVIPRSFDANTATGAVRIEVVATSHEKLLAYVDALNAGVGMDGDSLYWGMQQTQIDPAARSIVATIVARRLSVSTE